MQGYSPSIWPTADPFSSHATSHSLPTTQQPLAPLSPPSDPRFAQPIRAHQLTLDQPTTNLEAHLAANLRARANGKPCSCKGCDPYLRGGKTQHV